MTERKRTGAETMNRDSDCGGVRKPALIFDLDGTLWGTRKPVVTPGTGYSKRLDSDRGSRLSC